MKQTRETYKTIASNAIATLVLSGQLLATDSNEPGELRDLVLMPGQPKSNPPLIRQVDPQDGNPLFPLPDLPSSRLPPPGKMKLTVRLGRQIGTERGGYLYSATVDSAKSTSALKHIGLPPLVVKVSPVGMAGVLLPEAQSYLDLERFQGITIPHFYGLFTATVPNDSQFLPWQRRREEREGDNDPSDHPLARELPSNVVSVLVMERVGGPVPLDDGLLKNPRTVAELKSLYKDLASLGYLHFDMTYFNIAMAPSHPPLHRRVSPAWNRPYRFRLVNFHRAKRAAMEREKTYTEQANHLQYLINQIYAGCVL
ncbi:hypothetical protein BXZ70DRAFT_919348 [Cristinia sonorae]|uniref:Uncharacterized protein n=1 Tax=Cristinia sonorae TaxID=1940300 RepID=A0A8K0UVX5_9AGAR|nr:hypothetical protein BXZ70DRAFT_919348 [Cristinia sonorae]